ncbi:MAG: hypothetical protein ABL927_13135 [Bdellovibrionales bacterium]
MRQIVLIEPDQTLRDILKLNLIKNTGCDVIEKNSANDGLSLIQILPYLDLIICRETVNTAKSGLTISNFLESESRTTPLLVIGTMSSNYKHLTTVDNTQSWEYIVSVAEHILGIAAKPVTETIVSPYVPVGIHYFLNLPGVTIGCDVFIRVKKGEKDFQYVKRLHAGDQFTEADLKKYEESGLEEFYIPRVQFTIFVNFVTGKLMKQLSSSNLDSKERFILTRQNSLLRD